MATGNIAGGGDSSANLLNLVSMLKGTKTTTKSNMSKEGMDALVKQILGSASGLSGIASGQKNAGMYGSTTAQLLTNDLISRTAGELEKQRAGTTTKTPPKISGGDILGLVAMSAGKSLIGPTVAGFGKKFSTEKLGEQIASGLGLGGESFSNINEFAPSPDSAAIDLFGGTGITDALADFGGSIADTFADWGSEAGTDVASSVAEEGGESILDWIFG